MARPLRISFEGALYHITSRGNERRKIFLSREDRGYFLTLLSKTVERYKWNCYGYCLMDNHYHLLIETLQGNVSLGMRHLNGVYTQYFNRRYKRVGHLFQGRFKGIIVEKGRHLLELCRYVVLNPVRAKVCEMPEGYEWSSYLSFVGKEAKPSFLDRDWVLSQFGKSRERAVKSFAGFVREGISDNPWERLKGQIYFGTEAFIESLEKNNKSPEEIPRAHKQPLRPELDKIIKQPAGISVAYRNYGYRLKEIAKYLGVHYATVSRRLKHIEENNV